MDLYLRHCAAGAPVLYRAAGIAFTPEAAARLDDAGVQSVYVLASDHGVYRKMLGDRLSRLLRDPGADPRVQAAEAHTVCTGLVEDVLASPREPAAVEAVGEISRHLAQWATQREDAFTHLMRMWAHDYYTAAHMVNVSVGCGLLFKELRPLDRQSLPGIIQGGLLHDIGKRAIPASVLNKVGKLTPKEWQLVRAHPRVAHEELREHPGIAPVVLEMARDHHERLDGRGYPNELPREKIGFAARVCAVADVYDALTSNRRYRKALTPRQALALMVEGVGSHFDPGILSAWCALVERLLALQPTGAADARVPTKLTLDGFLPHCEVSGAIPLRPSGNQERRAHPRHACNTIVRACFVTQGRECSVAVGEQFPVLAVDVSRTGLQIRTPWPLSLDDRLEIRVPTTSGSELMQMARVVRVAASPHGRYLAGLLFVAAAESGLRREAA
jgi:HD-GYP domain-containing protein (c-di-GMP phosphodiesterase class II)